MTKKIKAKLILEDGSEFSGYSFGFGGNVNGEVVFNTGMVGYPKLFQIHHTEGKFLSALILLLEITVFRQKRKSMDC